VALKAGLKRRNVQWVEKRCNWQDGNNGGILQKLASRNTGDKLSDLVQEGNAGGKSVRTVRKEK
jgi:hypothetical protein